MATSEKTMMIPVRNDGLPEMRELQEFADGVPRCRATDLGRCLGYARDRNVTLLVDRLRKSKVFGETIHRHTVKQRIVKGGARQDYAVDETWLTEKQALMVCARSETERGAEILGFVLDVFIAARDMVDARRRDWNHEFAKMKELLLSAKAGEWILTFPPSLVRAMSLVYARSIRSGAQPRWLAAVWRKIYETVFSKSTVVALRLSCPRPRHGNNWSQWLNENTGARAYFKSQIQIVEAIAAQSDNRTDFWRRMKRQYRGGMLQVRLDLAEGKAA